MVVRTLLAILLMLAAPASAQEIFGPPAPGSTPTVTSAVGSALRMLESGNDGDLSINPVSILDTAGKLVPGQSAESSGLSPAISIMLLLTVIALVPSIILMCTCFVRILVVLGLLKQAIGTQSLPPTQVTTGLAVFMTMLVMAPTAQRVWNEAIVPHNAGEIRNHEELWNRAKQPLRDFMFDQIEATGNWSSVYMVLNYRGIDTREPEKLTRADVDMTSLIPAFMLSELKVAFMMGFRLYLPFLVIDIVIASLLISMSMMMLPPVLISLPFKLMLFVLVDGWQLVVGSLLTSFRQPEVPARMSQALPVFEPALRPLGLA